MKDDWSDRARYDLDTAKTLLDAGRYLYVLFCCQQAVEKALKALIANRTGEMPPRIHNLPKLTSAAGVHFDEEGLDFLAALSTFYTQTRYPGEIELPETLSNREQMESIVRKTEDIVEWLFSKLK
jgi:HEPN domain-containing protein